MSHELGLKLKTVPLALRSWTLMPAACWSTHALCPAGSKPSPPSPCNEELKLKFKKMAGKKWRENSESTRASTDAREMAGKYETVSLVDHQKINGGKI
jgi:hypothetical protein